MCYDLERFVTAQNSPDIYSNYECAMKEMKAGVKHCHWIWYIFPQLRGLGRSQYSYHYGIVDLDEANAYMHHELLGKRLIEISEVLLAVPKNNPYQIFSGVDVRKLQSSMTLFSKTNDANPVFRAILEKFFDGKEDPATLSLLEQKA